MDFCSKFKVRKFGFFKIFLEGVKGSENECIREDWLGGRFYKMWIIFIGEEEMIRKINFFIFHFFEFFFIFGLKFFKFDKFWKILEILSDFFGLKFLAETFYFFLIF